jgi:predicted component of type VI protein secretion system
MGVQVDDLSPQVIVQRIDAIMQELGELRQMIIRIQTKLPKDNLAEQLYGILGKGTWGEYDLDLEWQRFSG